MPSGAYEKRQARRPTPAGAHPKVRRAPGTPPSCRRSAPRPETPVSAKSRRSSMNPRTRRLRSRPARRSWDTERFRVGLGLVVVRTLVLMTPPPPRRWCQRGRRRRYLDAHAIAREGNLRAAPPSAARSCGVDRAEHAPARSRSTPYFSSVGQARACGRRRDEPRSLFRRCGDQLWLWSTREDGAAARAR